MKKNSVLNNKKFVFPVVIIVSIVLALCFMIQLKGVNGGEVTYGGVDMINERNFAMDEIISSATAYMVSSPDYYFEAPGDYHFCSGKIYNFLFKLPVSTIVDGEVNPMHEPQSDGIIKISNDDCNVSVIFHDDFSKMYMEKHKSDGSSIRSKDYAVDTPAEAKKFFAENSYLDDYRIWEYNPASSALGDGQIVFWFESCYKINGEIKGGGKIEKLINEDTGAEGISWSPEIIDNPGVYEFEIPVIRDGEERVFSFGMEMAGKRGVASYYIIRQGNMRINSNNDRNEYEMVPEYSVDSAKWMYNSMTSDHLTISVPNGYKIKFVAATSGKTVFYEPMFFDLDSSVSWTPGKIGEDAQLVIDTEKDGRSVKFTLDIKFLEYFPAGERMSYEIIPVDCWMHNETDGSGIIQVVEK